MATIKDVAKLAGVSISTVSSVINKNKNVSDELEQRVEAAIKELGYETNPVARSLKNRKTGIIGVILPNITSIFFPQVLRGMEDVAYKLHYSLMFFDSNQDADKEKKYIRLLENRWVEGIILDSSADAREHSAYIDYLMQRVVKDKGIPIVSLERDLKDNEFNAVAVDNEEAGYAATKHLIGLSHKGIAHIAGNYKFPMSRDRRRGYKRALEECGIIFDEGLIKQGDFSPLSGYNAMKELLMEGKEFTALFAGNDQMAIGAMKAIKEAGLRVPEDIAVVGFDNIPAASLVDPALTTINVPKYRMGAIAMEMLAECIKSPGMLPRVEVLPSKLIIRHSSDPYTDGAWDLFGW